ncbi:hypothetical protein YC2023_037195 [Brassica napus]
MRLCLWENHFNLTDKIKVSSLTCFVVATDHVLGGVSEPAIQRGQFLDFQIGSGSGNANIDGGNGQQERSQ